ncbi:MAG: MFS transporter [Dehalococcoidia bacterium]
MLSRWFESTFDALREPHFRMLWFGTVLAFLAFNMSWIVQSVVAFNLTGKNSAVGLVWLGMGVANITIAPFGGVIADRVSKRRLLLIGQSAVGATFLAVGILILTDRITIALLVLSTFIMGAVFAFIGPARQAWVGQLLPPEKIPNGVALTQVGMTATRVIGPMLAGVLIALPFVRPGGTYIFMGALFIVVVATLAMLPNTPGIAREQRKPVLYELGRGLGHIQERPRLRLLALTFIGVTVTGFSYQVVFPGLLEHGLGRDPDQISILYTISAASGLLVTVLIAGLAGSRFAWSLMLWGGVLLGLCIVLSGLAPNFLLLALLMVPMGIGMSAFQMLNNALVMRESDPAYFGRVMSLTMMAWGFNSLAGFPFGALADAIGERPVLVIMGGLAIAVAISAASVHLTLARKQPVAAPITV